MSEMSQGDRRHREQQGRPVYRDASPRGRWIRGRDGGDGSREESREHREGQVTLERIEFARDRQRDQPSRAREGQARVRLPRPAESRDDRQDQHRHDRDQRDRAGLRQRQEIRIVRIFGFDVRERVPLVGQAALVGVPVRRERGAEVADAAAEDRMIRGETQRPLPESQPNVRRSILAPGDVRETARDAPGDRHDRDGQDHQGNDDRGLPPVSADQHRLEGDAPRDQAGKPAERAAGRDVESANQRRRDA
jgi:hypothetical protein